MTSRETATGGGSARDHGETAPLSADDVVRLQAEHHPLVTDERFANAEQYCLHLIHLKAYELASGMAAGKDVLDLGCNNGYGSCRVAEVARSVVGVDVSPQAIVAANARPHGATVRFELVDGSTLPFPEASFDLVMSFQVIEHVAEVEGYLREVLRVLRPGGSFVLTTPNASFRLEPGQKPWNPFHVRELTGRELGALLQPWFADVSVRGLFAQEPLRGIETRRIEGIRRLVRAEASVGPLRRAFRGLKAAARSAMEHSTQNDAGVRHLAAENLPKTSLADLFYRDVDLDDALDLLAICRQA